MKIGRARPGFHVHVRTSSSPILRVVERSLDLELLNGIRSGYRDPGSAKRSDLGEIGAIAVRIHAVEHEIVVAATGAVRADLLASGPQLGGIHDVSIRSSGQAENFGKVAIDQRQFLNRFAIDDSSESGILRLKERRFCANRDLFFCAADRQLNLQPAHLGDLNPNTLQDEWLKSGRANRQIIVARRQEWDREISLGIRSDMALFACGVTSDDHCCICYRGSTGVAHAASDGTGVGCLAIHRQSAEREHGGPEQGAERV